jgi:alginate O-acetyltransferase complex protein AlgI
LWNAFLEFVVFLVAVVGVYWLLGRRSQNVFLLIASYVFYGFVNPWLVLLLVAFTGVNFGCAVLQEFRPNHRKLFMLSSVIFSLSVLGYFKYFNFFISSFVELFNALGGSTFGRSFDILLPIGISFFTFQTIGYAIDVYRHKVAPTKNLIDFAVFVAFFPQLVAGPIERANRLLPQFQRTRRLKPEAARLALVIMAWGFFKKLVIADQVAVIADRIFATAEPGLVLLAVGTLAFGIQIYADFSGYTDIARGAAKLFGINLSRNFNHPYLARSPREFWRRWHISLSSWFRDYVYVPLGGSHSGHARNLRALLVTFIVSGLWHGASWNFALWGAYHGLLLAGQRYLSLRFTQPLQGVLGSTLTGIVTFSLVTFGWLLFRDRDLYYVSHLFEQPVLPSGGEGWGPPLFLLMQTALWALPIWLHPIYTSIASNGRASRVVRGNAWVFDAGIATILLAAVMLLRGRSGSDFIYFQF